MWRFMLLAAICMSTAIADDPDNPDNQEMSLGQSHEMTYSMTPDDDKAMAQDKEDIDFEHELEAFGAGPAHQESYKKSPLDGDVLSHVHSVPIEEEEAIVGGYIFDVDDNNRNPNQRCYVRNQGADKTKMPDNIENSIVDAQDQLNDDGTARSQWTKCLPPPMYTLLSVESFGEGDIYNGRYEKRMRNATDFYATLKWLHNEACAHIRIRLENKVMLSRIQEEVNYRARLGIGFKIKQALMPIIKKIVEQYHSTNPGVNAANAKTMALIKEAIGPLKQALRVARHSSMVTLENGEGRRRNTATSSAKELMDPLYNNAMKFDVASMEQFIATRPGPLDDMMTGSGKRGLGEPTVGSDGLPDSLKNFGRCGKPLFDFAGYTLYTLTVSQNKKEEITFLTKDGWLTPEQIVVKSMNVPLRAVLPPDAYEVETKTTSYQDDMFASGNLACGDRADGLWTLTSYDRDSNENKVTATQEEGYFCVWMLNDLLVLPENQRAGFSNTEFVAESPQEMARVMNGDAENYKKYFPKPGEKYKYYHCHYAPRNSGAARVHSFQHQAERHYPGGIRQYCNCDWRRMGMVVSRCDCTLDAKANGGCRRVEMEMLNEHTQFDLWRKDGNKKVPSRVAMVHGDLAEGKIKSYTYQNNRRRRQPDNQNIYQADTGRVRQTTDGNGGNNVVCSVNEAGVPAQQAARTFSRNKGNIKARSIVDPTKDPNCKPAVGLTEEKFYFNQNGNFPNFNGQSAQASKTVTEVNYGHTTSTWSGFSRNSNYAARWWGNMHVTKSDNYYFSLQADNGARLYLNNDQVLQNGVVRRRYSWYRQEVRRSLQPGTVPIRIEYFSQSTPNGMMFYVQDGGRRTLPFAQIFKTSCGSLGSGTTFERTFFADLNGNGIMDYPECRRRRSGNQAHRRRGVAQCTDKGNEFPLRDIYTSNTVYPPAGGINYEFVDKNGHQCDILKLKHECKLADAGDLQEGALAIYLSKFCDVPAALYQVPVNASGHVPADFGAVTAPMPFRGYGQKWSNYRASAVAEFGAVGKGTKLFCKPGTKKCAGNEPLAVQGEFRGIADESVFSGSEDDNVVKSRFYPQVGGSTNGNVPSAVNTRWTQAGTQASGDFNNDVMERYRASTNPGTLYAKDRVWADSTRGEGVTCLNGKYVYARKEKDGSRPVVSTIREGLNRDGPLANGNWACRYVGVHCNANNCNNNGNTEIAGPFVEPKMKAKKEEPTPKPTDKPKPTKPKPGPELGNGPTDKPAPAPTPAQRRRRGKGGKGGKGKKAPAPAPAF